jgi:thioesterase domain-containing protein
LVSIQAEGSSLPFFCVHGIGGNVLGFYDLSRYLGASQPFYGLQAQGLNGKTPVHTRVEDMAAHYVKEVRDVQPEGPYLLGGLSFGGALAFEMARQLRAQGQKIGLVALFDTFAGRPESKTSLLVKFLRLPLKKKLMYILQKARFITRGVKRWFYRIFLPSTLKKVRAAHRLAYSRYVMTRYEGPVTLFVPSDRSLRGSDDPERDWKTFASEVEVHEVPGDHETLLDEPHVRILGEHLAACLKRAQNIMTLQRPRSEQEAVLQDKTSG